ncbi:MAG: TonB-dependent receptor [Acidobacteria bacterium]|nr:TonB-dependent receptor [Acidobacteriota bacterium]
MRWKSFLFFLTLAVYSAFAQDPRGAITGTLMDSSDAAIPGVAVRAVNSETGVAASAVSNATGSYQIPFLPPGFYKVTAELTGFKRFSRDKIEVRVGDSVGLPIRMEVGAVTETVEVTATTPLLDTTTSSLGQVIDQRRILELPQRGGTPMELTLLTPGVVNSTDMRLRKAMSPEAVSQIATDGAGTYNNEFQIDGINNMAADRGRGYARIAFSPPSGAVREFKMQTTAYDASIGHTMGSVVNVSTASGTNDLHGEVHYTLRHSRLDAPNFFNNKSGATLGVYQDHRSGGSVGGPVVVPGLYNGRNRTFWFYVFEDNRFGVPRQSTSTVPSAAERLGDFSELLRISGGSAYQIYDLFTTVAAAGGRFSRQPLAGNIIPKSRLDTVGLNLAALYPLPNQPGTVDGRNNFFLSNKAIQKTSQQMLRLDHAFSENHRAFLRLQYDFWKENKNETFGTGIQGLFSNRPNRGVALDDVIVINPMLVLNLRYGFTSTKWWEYRRSRGYNLASLGFSPALLNLTDKEAAPIPRLSVGAFTAISNWENGDGVNSSLTHTFSGSLTSLQGRHSMKFGAEYRLERSFNDRHPTAITPDFSFGTTYTRGPLDNSPASTIGQDLASMLMGIPSGSMDRNASSALQDNFIGLYFHDDLKLTSRLTMNIGLRWEFESPVTERYNRFAAAFDNTTPNPIEAQAKANYARSPIPELAAANFRVLGGLTWVNQGGTGRSPFLSEKNAWMPRLGFAYQLDPKTTLRGGYGMFYTVNGIYATVPIQTGFSQTTPIQASLDNGLTFVARTPNPFPNGLLQAAGPGGGLKTNLGQGISFHNPRRARSYSQRWSLGLQRMLPGEFVVDASYVGSRSTRLTVNRNYNSTPAQYLSKSPVRDQATIDFLSATFASPFYGIDPIYGRNMSRGGLLRPYPQFGDISSDDPAGYSWYHSLQMRTEKRFSHGFTLQVAYTFSKTMEAVEFLNATDPMPYESLSTLDRPHRVAASGVWELPFGKGRQFGSGLPAAVDTVLGGWQLGAVITRQGGAPLGFGNILFAGDIKGIPLPKSQKDVDRWFNTEAGFNRNTRDQLASNVRRFPPRFSGVRGDDQRSSDFSIVKKFSLSERAKLQFRADVYNGWNQTNFANPNTSPTNSSFGRITATAGDARNWQLGLKLAF